MLYQFTKERTETNVISGIMSCMEVMHNITKKQVRKLENIDEIYLRKLLRAPVTTAIEALYIETGKIPIGIILKMRRLLYWWNIVSQDSNSMLYKIYKGQCNNAVKGDWCLLLEEDKKEFGLESVKDEELTTKFKNKLRFKTFIKKKAVKLASEYLGKLKEKHSKLDDLSFTKLEPATYLFDSRINKKQTQLLFKLRTRMYNVKANFPGNHLFNMICDLCKASTCDQRHLMSCSVLKQEVAELKNTQIKYSHLFSSIEKIVPAINLFSAIDKKREEMLEKKREMMN